MWSGEGTGESNELLMKRKLGIGRNLQTSVELLPTTYSRASEIGQTSGLRLYGTECFYPAPHALESTTGRGTCTYYVTGGAHPAHCTFWI